EDGNGDEEGSVSRRRSRREPGRADGSVFHAESRRRRTGGHRNHRRERALVDVTDVLRDRRGEPDGLGSMAAVSLAMHAVIFAFLLLGPLHLLSSPAEPPKSV